MRRRPSPENSRRGACRAWAVRSKDESEAHSQEAEEGWLVVRWAVALNKEEAWLEGRVVRWAATRHQEEAWRDGRVVRWAEAAVCHLRSTMRR